MSGGAGDAPEIPTWREALDGKNVLVTGASGFIGGAVVAALAGNTFWRRSGGRIIALCRNVQKGRRKLGRFGDAVTVASWELGQPFPNVGVVDAVVHAAGCASPVEYVRKPATLLRENLAGCAVVLDYAREARADRFVFISSGEVYGNRSRPGKFREDDGGEIDPLSVRAPYPLAKIACEALCASYCRQWNTPVCIARLCHVYGPGADRSDPRIAVQFPLAAAEGRRIVLKSCGEQMRAFCHVDDAASGILTILARGEPGAAYNIADEALEMTIFDFAKRVAGLGDTQVVFDIPSGEEARAFNPMTKALFSTERLRALGWSAKVELERGLRDTLTWFQTQSDMEQP